MQDDLLERARQDSGLTQDEVARRAHTSRPTLSAYEHGRKSPTLATARRLLEATGHDLEAVPRVEFHHHVTSRGSGLWVGFSWFHVNLLGVGLHAYGFSAGLKNGVFTFYGCQLLVLLVGAVGHVLHLRPAPAAGQGAVSRAGDKGTPPVTAPAAK